MNIGGLLTEKENLHLVFIAIHINFIPMCKKHLNFHHFAIIISKASLINGFEA